MIENRLKKNGKENFKIKFKLEMKNFQIFKEKQLLKRKLELKK